MQSDRLSSTTPIYTVGQDGRDLRTFAALLQRFDIRYLIDIRVDPGAEHLSDFSLTPLSAAMKEAGITYAIMGDLAMEQIEDPESFKRKLHRLRNAVDGGYVVALLLDEGEAERIVQLMIGYDLRKLGIDPIHINRHVQPQSALVAPVAAATRAAATPTITLDAKAPLATAAPTLDGARHKLKEVFGYDEFLPMQAEVIDSVLRGRDTVAIMPTGGGKSLCYQLPALLFPGLTVVVSPLISLMQDQVDQLRDYGVAAAFLNSHLNWQEQQSVMNAIRGRRLKLLYVAPESLLRDDRLAALASANVSCLTIDEAHCISQWGHDFRPEYRQLLDVRRQLPGAVTVALTATATARVRADIRQSLGMNDPAEFVAGFDRPNLNLMVKSRTDGMNQLTAFLRKRAGQSGIVYCLTRKTVEEVASELQLRGYNALPYHAGFENEKRLAAQRAFAGDEVPIIVATIAFGMGINKPNVRFVVHYNLPQSLEGYYQEIGRAGRDGLPSDCLLLTSDSDLRTIRFFFQDKDKHQRAAAEERLQAMLGYVRASDCRRRPLLAYFGERYGQAPCGACDRCLERAAGQPAGSRPRANSERQPAAAASPGPTAPQRMSYDTAYDPALFEYLLSIRKELAAKTGVPSYQLFSSKVLREMATYFPHSMDSLRRIKGVDLAHVEQYGGPLLEAVRSYCARYGIRERIPR